MRIKNTLRRGEFWVTAALLDEARRDPAHDILAGPGPLPLAQAGTLADLLPEPVNTLVAPSAHSDAW